MADLGKRYLFTGGGTGGHVTPNLAILSELQARSTEAAPAEFLYVGSAGGYERRVEEKGIRFKSVPCAPFCSPRRLARFTKMAFRILAGVIASIVILLKFRPHVVVASGGYVSVPMVMAAWLTGRRVYVHEQNVHPGLANRILSKLATKVGVSFEETVRQFPKNKTVHAGYPVRSQIAEGSGARARERFKIPAHRRVAFIVGGSMGSRSINRGTVEALKTLLKDDDLAIIHSTGLTRSSEYKAFDDTRDRLLAAGLDTNLPGRYVCQAFFENIQDVYAMADIVVARAGAGTIMELATVGKPSILIPKSDVPGDHQLMNAVSLERTGSAQVLFEERSEEGGQSVTRVRGDTLAQKIGDLMVQNDELAAMGLKANDLAVKDSLSIHADIVLKLAANVPLVQTVQAMEQTGVLVAEDGSNFDLAFRTNSVGRGLLNDIKIPNATTSGRALITRFRKGDQSEFLVKKRSGQVAIDNQEVRKTETLPVGSTISIGHSRFQFAVKERLVERTVPTGTMGLRVLVTSLGTFTSRIFGFARDAILAATFGLSNVMDIMVVALAVSNYFRGVFAEQAIDSAFLPTFIHLQRTGQRESANRLLSSVLGITIIASGAVTLAAILTLPLWMHLLAPKFADRGIMEEAIQLTRIMFPYLMLISVAAVLAAVLKACNKFAVPAFSSLLFSVGILTGLVFYPALGIPALGFGVLLGGVLQVAAHIPSLLSSDVREGFGVKLSPSIDLSHPGVRKVGRVTPNIIADVGIQRASSMVDTILATAMASGMMSALWFAMLLFRLPFGLISQSINTVVLKELSEGQAVQDRDFTRKLLSEGLNWTAFTLLPISVVMIVLAEPLVGMVFGFGRFNTENVSTVATVLQFYSIGLLGWGVTGLCGRFFAARMEQNRNTWTSAVGLTINIGASISLVRAGYGVAGLAAGTSLGFLSIAGIRLALLNRSLRDEGSGLRLQDCVPSLMQTGCASGAALVALLVANQAVESFSALPPFLNRVFVFAVPAAFGAAAFLAAAVLVRSEQLEQILIRFGRKRQGPQTPSQPRPVNPYCIDPPVRLLTWVKRNRNSLSSYNFAGRARNFLDSPDWKVRNIGVKLVGELSLRALRGSLVDIIRGREPAPLSHRLLGADFEQPGFLRRNALAALEQLGDPDLDTEQALLTALADPYFEARAQAARSLGVMAHKFSDESRQAATVRLGDLTEDKNFEVAQAAVCALSQSAQDASVIEVLKKLHYHRNWKVRDAVVLGYARLYERGVTTDKKRLLALLDDVLATSEDFVPRFVLKENMRALQQRLIEEDPA